MNDVLKFLKLYQEIKETLPKDQLFELLQVQLSQVEVYEKILKAELSSLRGEEKKIEFQHLPQAPQIISQTLAQEGELTAKDVDFSKGLQYDLKYPPEDLLDAKKNRQVINLGIDKGIVFFLRTFRHPYRQTPPANYYNALAWLIDVENIPEDLVRYLLTGTGAENFPKVPYNAEMSEDLDIIDTMIEQYSEAIKKGAEMIVITPERIALTFSLSSFIFDEHLKKDFVEKHLNMYGFSLDPNEIKIGNIRQLRKMV